MASVLSQNVHGACTFCLYLIQTLCRFFNNFSSLFVSFLINLCPACFLKKTSFLAFKACFLSSIPFARPRKVTKIREAKIIFKTHSYSSLRSFRGLHTGTAQARNNLVPGKVPGSQAAPSCQRGPNSKGNLGPAAGVQLGAPGSSCVTVAPHPYPVWEEEKGEGRDFYQIFPEGRGLHPLELLPHG